MRANEGKKPDKQRYKTTNWCDYNKALKARGSLTVWLDKDMQWFAAPTGQRGRHPTFSDAAIQFCLSIKCLLGLALRQALGFVQSLLRLVGLEWPVPDYSTGIKFLGEGEWKRKSAVPDTAGNGARCIWASMPRPWRYGPSK